MGCAAIHVPRNRNIECRNAAHSNRFRGERQASASVVHCYSCGTRHAPFGIVSRPSCHWALRGCHPRKCRRSWTLASSPYLKIVDNHRMDRVGVAILATAVVFGGPERRLRDVGREEGKKGGGEREERGGERRQRG